MASKKKAKTLFVVAAALVGFLVGGLSVPLTGTEEPQYEVIVQGRDMDEVFRAVHEVGGEVTHELSVIKSVGARLTKEQIRTLSGLGSVVRIYKNRNVAQRRSRDNHRIAVRDHRAHERETQWNEDR